MLYVGGQPRVEVASWTVEASDTFAVAEPIPSAWTFECVLTGRAARRARAIFKGRRRILRGARVADAKERGRHDRCWGWQPPVHRYPNFGEWR